MLPLSLRVSAYGLCAVAGHGKVVLSGATFFLWGRIVRIVFSDLG